MVRRIMSISEYKNKIMNMKGILKRLRLDNKGASALIIGFSLVPIIGIVGFATDISRAYIVKSRLGDALDAAALAGGRTLFNKEQHVKNIKKYFHANIKGQLMGATITGPFEVDKDGIVLADDHAHTQGEKLMRIKATANVPTLLMSIFTDAPIEVSNSAEVTREIAQLDLVLAIDMSGSMGSYLNGKKRLNIAVDSAKSLVNILYGPLTTSPLINIGIVPWSSTVNISNGTSYNGTVTKIPLVAGPATNPYSAANYSFDRRVYKMLKRYNGRKMTWHMPKNIYALTGSPVMENVLQNYEATLTDVYYAHNAPNVPLLARPAANWKGCVYARYAKEDAWSYTFTNYSTPTSDGENEDDPIALANAADMIKGPVRIPGGKNWVGWYPMNLEETEYSSNTRYMCKLQFLKKNVRRSRKSSYYLGWGDYAYVYRPRSSSYCAPCLSQPITPMQHDKKHTLDAVEALRNKYKGGTNIPQGLAWAWRTATTGVPFNQASVPQANVELNTAIILLTDGENTRYIGDSYNRAITNRDKRLRDLSTLIKADGITIYTIQFANANGALQRLLEGVATSPKHYFQAPSEAELEKIFKRIADELSVLRISK
jgi:Flp pilus assembly protein TadG